MEILQGLLDGIAELDIINAAVRRSRDWTEAREAIVALGYTTPVTWPRSWNLRSGCAAPGARDCLGGAPLPA